MYCIDQHEDIYLEGTKDSVYKNESSAYFIYEVNRCSEDTMGQGYPKCASEQEIDDWMLHKYVFMRFLNQNVDFTSRDETAVKYNE